MYLEVADTWLGLEPDVLKKLGTETPYDLWLSYAKEKSPRVFLGDISFWEHQAAHRHITEILEGFCGTGIFFSTALAAKLGIKLTNKISRALNSGISERQISRRKFLVGGGAFLGGLTLASWLSLPGVSFVSEDLRLSLEDRGEEIPEALNGGD